MSSISSSSSTITDVSFNKRNSSAISKQGLIQKTLSQYSALSPQPTTYNIEGNNTVNINNTTVTQHLNDAAEALLLLPKSISKPTTYNITGKNTVNITNNTTAVASLPAAGAVGTDTYSQTDENTVNINNTTTAVASLPAAGAVGTDTYSQTDENTVNITNNTTAVASLPAATVQPNAIKIFLGRGGAVNKQRGNVILRHLIKKLEGYYRGKPYQYKKIVVTAVTNNISKFCKFYNDDKIEIDDPESVHTKISQKFRDCPKYDTSHKSNRLEKLNDSDKEIIEKIVQEIIKEIAPRLDLLKSIKPLAKRPALEMHFVPNITDRPIPGIQGNNNLHITNTTTAVTSLPVATTQPNAINIFLGRGATSTYNSGNVILRNVIKKLEGYYEGTPDGYKKIVVTAVINNVSKFCTFYNDDKTQIYDIKSLYTKIAQRFRDCSKYDTSHKSNRLEKLNDSDKEIIEKIVQEIIKEITLTRIYVNLVSHLPNALP